MSLSAKYFAAQLAKNLQSSSLINALRSRQSGSKLNTLASGSVGAWHGVSFISAIDPAVEPEEDLTLSQSILSSMQACERLLSCSENGDHAVKTKLDECLAQLQALKLVLALHGIVHEGDLERDESISAMLKRIGTRTVCSDLQWDEEEIKKFASPSAIIRIKP